MGKLLGMPLDQLRLEKCQLNSYREEQVLTGHVSSRVLPSEFLKQQPFMGGMLVDNQESLAVAAKNIEISELTYYLQSVTCCLPREK
jgi:hypothetical protein